MPSLPFEHNNTVAPLDYKFSRTKENIKKKKINGEQRVKTKLK